MAAINELDRDLKELEADYGTQVITWNGQDYRCTPSSVDQSVMLEIGGNQVIARSAVLVRDSIFPSSTPPAFGDQVTYRGQALLVALARNGHGIHTLLTLADPNQ